MMRFIVAFVVGIALAASAESAFAGSEETPVTHRRSPFEAQQVQRPRPRRAVCKFLYAVTHPFACCRR